MTRSWDYSVSFLMAFGVLTTWCSSGWILHGFVGLLISPAGLWCQVQKGAQKDYRASNVLVIGGRANWIVLAGGRRPPSLITQRLGGRPKVARACSLLILAPALRKSTVPSSYSLPEATQQTTFVFRFRLARLWRALISSVYIYIYMFFPLFLFR